MKVIALIMIYFVEVSFSYTLSFGIKLKGARHAKHQTLES